MNKVKELFAKLKAKVLAFLKECYPALFKKEVKELDKEALTRTLYGQVRMGNLADPTLDEDCACCGSLPAWPEDAFDDRCLVEPQKLVANTVKPSKKKSKKKNPKKSTKKKSNKKK